MPAEAGESCNGRDDDCDGEIDEGFGVGEACTVGRGICAAEGTQVCNAAGDGVACDARAGDPLPEICNGLDDDCDGAVDEGDGGGPLAQACYDGPEATAGVGLCRPGARTCTDGEWGACDGQVLPGAETCDRHDEDCDGETDEGFGTGEPCTVGRGACAREGHFVCNWDGDGVVCDALAGEPAPELCNGLDDDCDDAIDEAEGGGPLTEACYDGPEGTAGVGLCRPGTRTCAGGAWGACEGQVLPAAEVCDDQDHDCDGDPHDGLALAGAAVGAPCNAPGVCGEGVVRCAPDGTLECSVRPAAETCDGRDEDCDGEADDGFGVGRPCVVGVGACAAEGRFACSATGDDVVCDAEAGEPAPETCNGIDDDCDGSTDEDFAVGEPCTVGEGACAVEGRQVCNAGGDGVVCDVEAVERAPEACNGVDDDCDGAVDEDFAVGEPCSVGEGACAAEGTQVCNASGDGVKCDAEAGEPAPEACNGIDDDCDGAADEDFAVGEPCTVGEGACAVDGTQICNDAGDGVVCEVEAVEREPEVCNYADDDCDGLVDEGFAYVEARGARVTRDRRRLTCIWDMIPIPDGAALAWHSGGGVAGDDVGVEILAASGAPVAAPHVFNEHTPSNNRLAWVDGQVNLFGVTRPYACGGDNSNRCTWYTAGIAPDGRRLFGQRVLRQGQPGVRAVAGVGDRLIVASGEGGRQVLRVRAFTADGDALPVERALDRAGGDLVIGSVQILREGDRLYWLYRLAAQDGPSEVRLLRTDLDAEPVSEPVVLARGWNLGERTPAAIRDGILYVSAATEEGVMLARYTTDGHPIGEPARLVGPGWGASISLNDGQLHVLLREAGGFTTSYARFSPEGRPIQEPVVVFDDTRCGAHFAVTDQGVIVAGANYGGHDVYWTRLSCPQ